MGFYNILIIKGQAKSNGILILLYLPVLFCTFIPDPTSLQN